MSGGRCISQQSLVLRVSTNVYEQILQDILQSTNKHNLHKAGASALLMKTLHKRLEAAEESGAGSAEGRGRRLRPFPLPPQRSQLTESGVCANSAKAVILIYYL